MDFKPLVEQLSIRTKDLDLLPLRCNWAQNELIDAINRQYNAGKPVRIIVLKARQLGVSTLSEAVLFWWGFVHNRSYGLVLAHENDAAEYLLNMTKLYWDLFPFNEAFTTRYVSRKELSWQENGSSLRIATAGGKGGGRSRTINALHASEVAFYDHPDQIMLGMRQTIPNRPGSLIIMESTANGVGNWFFDAWHSAVEGKSEFEPLFFPWWRHHEYTGQQLGLGEQTSKLKLDDDERQLRKIGVDDDHLVWRRWAVRNLAAGDVERFHQEYPATPEEAFIASGTNVFPLGKLRQVYDPRLGVRGFLQRTGQSVEFIPDMSGPCTVFKTPSRNSAWGKYFLGADPTHTTMGDNACAQVINSATYEQVAVWHGKCDPMSFAEEIAKLGAYYNMATIACEIEGPGYAAIGRLVELDYPNIWRTRWADRAQGKVGETMGWSTTMKRKEWAIGWLIKLMVDDDITIHHPATYDEMRIFVRLENGGYGPASEFAHDDCVMALAIACLCNSTEASGSALKNAYESQLDRALGDRPMLDQTPAWELINGGETDEGFTR